MSTVYLRDTTISRIDCELGALVLESRTQAPRYLPLRLFTRLVSTGDIDWSSAALASCMNAAIPIALLNSQGENLGYISPANLPSLNSHAQLNPRLKHIPNAADFDAWARSRERYIMLRSLKAKNLMLQDLREDKLWQFLSDSLKKAYPMLDPIAIDAELQGLCKAWLYQELILAGFSRSAVLHEVNRSEITLLDAFNNAIRWVLRSKYSHWMYSAGNHFNAELAFENMSRIVETKLREELTALSHWVNDIYQQHGH